MAVNGTFQAFRPKSSSEFLALRRLQIQQSLNTVPSNNYQDSSEQTARFRKSAAAVAYKHGDSATLVKFKASSVVQAQREGSAYCCAVSNYVTPVNRISPGCSTMLSDPVTFPKMVGCSYRLPRAAPQTTLRNTPSSPTCTRSRVESKPTGTNPTFPRAETTSFLWVASRAKRRLTS